MTGPPRVTFVSSHAKHGGAEEYLVSLIRGLGPDWVATVICLEKGPLVERLSAKGVAVEVIQTTGSRVDIALKSLRLRRALKRAQGDVIHANGIKAALMTVLANRPRRSPVVWVKHDFSWDGRLAHLIARHSDQVVGVSAATLETFVEGGAKFHVVYNGIDPPLVDHAEARRLLEAETKMAGPFILLVGRMHPVKGHAEVLGAAGQVLAHDSDACFVFLGSDDPSTPDHGVTIRRMAEELELSRSVAFLGHRDDPARFMAGADLAVMPSVTLEHGGREGFPLSGLELMSLGIPVVAYASGGLPELLGDCGVLVPPGDRVELAAAISRLLDDTASRTNMARCEQERVRELFHVDRMVEQMKVRYREAVR